MIDPKAPAFPAIGPNGGYFGMTKREYFAVMILQGRLANGNMIGAVRDAVKIADQLIEELNKEQN